jgi:hypothetical protein
MKFKKIFKFFRKQTKEKEKTEDKIPVSLRDLRGYEKRKNQLARQEKRKKRRQALKNTV